MIEVIGLVLGVLGLFGIQPVIVFVDDTVGSYWRALTWNREKLENRLRAIVAQNTIELAEPSNAATFGAKIVVRNFIDFLTAVTERSQKRELEKCAITWLRTQTRLKPTKIAVPKLGNVMFAANLADRLRVPIVIVRQEPSQFVKGSNPLDGKVTPGDRVLIVDDVASDSEFLIRCVSALRQQQASILGVFVLVERTEGDGSAALSRLDLALHSILKLDDSMLGDLLSKAKLASPMRQQTNVD